MYDDIKDFKSIEEIIEYLKKNNKAQTHTDERIDKKGKKSISVWIDYDMRLFKIPKYLKDNKYIFEEYYDNQKYQYLFHKQLTIEDIDRFNIEKVSYIILRGYNIERICQGTIKFLLEEGLLLGLVERAKELKEERMNYSFEMFQKKALIRLLGMDKYECIMGFFEDKELNISKSRDFQKLFNSFYRIRRNTTWQKIYYDFFEKNRNNKSITFDEIIDYMYEQTNGNIEASFCSKMLATINPNMPIWDQYVLKNLEIRVDGLTKEEKLKNTKLAYKEIVENVNNILKEESMQKTIKEFRDFFPEFDFSDVKILDFILWNNRD